MLPTGFVQPQYTERYTFYTLSDDGVMLWVNGVQQVNNWTSHSAFPNTGEVPLDLIAGERYTIQMKYFEGVGTGTAKLYWSSASQPKEVIPSTRLYPGVPAAQVLVAPGGTFENLPTSSNYLRVIRSAPSKTQTLTGVDFWRETGSPILALPGGVRASGVPGGRSWSGVIPPGAFMGPSGCGTRLGVALIPDDRSKPTYVLHFSGTSNISGGFIKVGFVQDGVPQSGYRAVICGAERPVDDDAVNRERLYTLEDAVACLRAFQVPITSYVPGSGFAVDENGWVYWTHPAGMPVDRYAD